MVDVCSILEETWRAIENETAIIWTIKGHIETQSTPARLTRNRRLEQPLGITFWSDTLSSAMSAQINISVIDVGELMGKDGHTVFCQEIKGLEVHTD